MTSQTSPELIENAKKIIMGQVMFHEVMALVGEHKTVSQNVSDNQYCVNTKNKLTAFEESFDYRDMYRERGDWEIPERVLRECGDWIWKKRERHRANKLLGCKEVKRIHAGGNSRSTVSEKISSSLLGKISRHLRSSRVQRVTKILAKKNDLHIDELQYPSYFVFANVELQHDISALPGFLCANKYDSYTYEFGIWRDFRFFRSEVLKSIEAAGSSVRNTDLWSVSNHRLDVYPLIITGQDAWSSVAFRDWNSFDLVHRPAWLRDSSNLFGKKGEIATLYWDEVIVQNPKSITVVEVGTTDPSLL